MNRIVIATATVETTAAITVTAAAALIIHPRLAASSKYRRTAS